MKELYESNGITIAIMDENNYVVYDARKPITRIDKGKERSTYKYAYFSQINHAVKECSRLVANEMAVDLESWLKVYAQCICKADDMLNRALARVQAERGAAQ